jgi:hypothetical protein
VRRNHARNSGPAAERPSSRDLVDYSPFFSFSSSRSLFLCLHHHRPALDNNSLQARRPMRPIPNPFRLHCPILSFLPYFPPRVSLSRTTQRCYHAALVRSHFHLFLVIPLCLQLSILLPFRQPRGRHYYTKPRHSAHVYKTTLLLVEEGMNRIPSITV